MRDCLGSIIAPYSRAEFVAGHFQPRVPLHVRGGGDRFASLFSWDALTSTINRFGFPISRAKLILDGRPIAVSSKNGIINAIRNGASLILEEIDRHDEVLGTFIDDFSRQLSIPARFNLYLSQPDRQAYDTHYDTHDFFILQIEGRKEWRVFPATIDNPLFRQKVHAVRPPPADSLIGKYVLRKGDTLFVPKGCWHDALCVDEPSVHLTLALFTPTRIDFLTWLVDELRDNESFRREFSIFDDGDVLGGDRWAAVNRDQLVELRRLLDGILTDPDLLDGFYRYTLRSLEVRRGFQFPGQFLEPAAGGEHDAFLRIHDNLQILSDESAGRVLVEYHGREISLDIRFRPLLDAVLHRLPNRFTVGDVARAVDGVEHSEICAVLASFAHEGLVKQLADR